MLDEAFNRAIVALRQLAGLAPLSIFIDPTLRDPVRHDQALQESLSGALRQGLANVYRLPQIHDDFDPDRHPLLLHVRSEPAAERVVAAALHLAVAEAYETEAPGFSGRTVCAFIVHDTDPAHRARALARAAQVRKPNGQRHFLRLWDPRVNWHLPRCLPAEQWAALRSALGSWVQMGVTRQLTTLDGAEVTAPPDARAHWIDAPAWQGLERIASVNKVLAMSWNWGLQPTDTMALEVDRLVARSIAQGLASEQDQLVFAACGLTAHAQFDRHPQVRDALRRAVLDGRPLQAALEPFDDTFWAQLQASSDWLDHERTKPA